MSSSSFLTEQFDPVGQFTQEELNVVITKIKSMKAAGLDEIPPEDKEI